jgi:hypothetical protein
MVATSKVSRRMIFTAIAAVIVMVAFWRGNHLLGISCGVSYALMALALIWLLARSLSLREGISVFRVALALLFAASVGFCMAFPASVNWRVQYAIERHAIDRSTRSELVALFGSDPAFRSLSVSTEHFKLVCITVHGSLATRADFDRLRTRIGDDCPTVGECILHWDIVLSDSGVRIDEIEGRELS